jgi:hypothetical protein
MSAEREPLAERLKTGSNMLRENAHIAGIHKPMMLDIADVFDECIGAILSRDATIAALRIEPGYKRRDRCASTK